jgi:hypothetical protein
MRPVHSLALEVANAKLKSARAARAGLSAINRRERLRTELAGKLGDIQPNKRPAATTEWKKQLGAAQIEGISLEVEPGIVVPLLMMRPFAAGTGRTPVIVGVSQSGKERFVSDRTAELEALLKAGHTVCLPDVRGTGETAMDTRRGRSSQEQTMASVEFMLGNTLLGSRLKDLRTVLAYLAQRQDVDASRITLWGDSFSPANPERLVLDELPGWQIGPEAQYQAEPLGGLLALLGGLYEDGVHAVAARGSLVGYASVLEDNFAYVPNDVIVPGILEVADLADVAAALSPRPLLLEGTVDGRNRRVGDSDLRMRLAAVRNSYRDTPSHLVVRADGQSRELVGWLAAQER